MINRESGERYGKCSRALSVLSYWLWGKRQLLESSFWETLCPEDGELAEEHYTEDAAEEFFVTYQVLFDHDGKNVLAPQWLVDAMNE